MFVGALFFCLKQDFQEIFSNISHELMVHTTVFIQLCLILYIVAEIFFLSQLLSES